MWLITLFTCIPITTNAITGGKNLLLLPWFFIIIAPPCLYRFVLTFHFFILIRFVVNIEQHLLLDVSHLTSKSKLVLIFALYREAQVGVFLD